jgi:hypothetical protein
MGGERQRGSNIHDRGYFATAQCTRKSSSYLEPISGSMPRTIGGGIAIGKFSSQYMLKNLTTNLFEA